MAKKVKKYLVLGNYGNCNIGDETLLRQTIKEILSLNPLEKSPEIIVPTRNLDFVGVYHKKFINFIRPIYLFNLPTLLKESIFCDKIYVGGGGIWSGYTGPAAKLLPIYLSLMGILRKDISVIGIGIYDTANKFERFLVNLGLIFSKKLEVRDKESFNNLWKINKRKARIREDLAISLLNETDYLEDNSKEYKLFEKKNLSKIKNKKNKLIGISIKPTRDVELNESICNHVANYINFYISNNKANFIFLPFAKTNSKIEDDMYMYKKIKKQIRFGGCFPYLDHDDPTFYFNFIRRNIDLIIGMRFHAVIFGFCAKKSLIALPYENKVLNFIKEKKIGSSIGLRYLDSSKLIKETERNV